MFTTILKTALSTATGIGIGTMTAEATKRLIPEGTHVVVKVCCHTAGCATASYVGYKVGEYSEAVIDEFADIVKRAIKHDKKEETVKVVA